MSDAKDESESNSTPAKSNKRQRARNACLACRRRKRKCDSQFPCSMCTNYGYRCEYPADESKVAPYIDHPAYNKTSPDSAVSNGSVMNVGSLVGNDTSPPANTYGRTLSTIKGEAGILDPHTSRFVSKNSTDAFPRTLAADLQSATSLPLNSYGWNCGIRQEESPSLHQELRHLISYAGFCQYADVYWTTVAPIFSFLDRTSFFARAEAYWSGAAQDLSFNAIVGGVIAVGSFFSHHLGFVRELEIVDWVKRVLDDPAVVRLPTVDRIIAWILRTIYLRATTRPHVSWLSSCLTLHLIEATGLHHEIQALKLTTDRNEDGAGNDEARAERARKVFWLAWSLNTMISYEYGRSNVAPPNITCQPVTHQPGEFTVSFIHLAQQLPSDSANDTPMERKQKLHEGLLNLRNVDDDVEYICMTKGDIALCYYRRLRMLDHGIEKDAVTLTIEFGKNAVQAALRLAQMNRPWWQVLGTCFQYICCLLAMDTAESLAQIKTSVDALENIVQILNTHLAQEALNTVKILVRDSIRKKRRELDLLGSDDPEVNAVELDENFSFNVDWDNFFDPSLSGQYWDILDFNVKS